MLRSVKIFDASDSQRIQEIAALRGIKRLVHFTRVENLASILSAGLLPRYMLNRNSRSGPTALVCDHDRHDGHTNAVNLSIEFPNYRMFYQKRCQDEDPSGKKWCVLELNPRLLWTLKCAFCWGNAARADLRQLTVKEKSGPESLKCCFVERLKNMGKIIQRQSLGIPDRYPTDPQTEVLVFGEVSPQYVLSVTFPATASRDRWVKVNPRAAEKIQLKVSKCYFYPRSDYSFWSGKQQKG